MAIVINGSGTVTGISVGGLPDDIVDAGTLATNSVDSAELIDGAVDNSHIDTMAASKLTGALPAIDGSNLTGIATPITALNNATESELVTVGSTTTELDAESGLTYDGSTLAVTGALTATGTFSSVGITDNATVNAIGIGSNERVTFGGYNGGTVAAVAVNANHGAAGDYSSLNGGITIRLISAADSNLYVMQFHDLAEQGCGTITTNASANTIAFNTSCDYRLKENLVPLADSITRLKLLKPYTFDWKKTENTSGGEGFVAHELDEVVPLAVTGEKDAMKPEILWKEGDELPEGVNVGDVKRAEMPDFQGIDLGKLVPLLTGALQEAVTKIEELTTRIEVLENE